MANPFYITTPIYYVNDVPHIGHAYTTIASDMMARFARMAGREVFFLTGTDEHGQKIQKAAQTEGTDPQVFVDRVSERFQALTPLFHLSNDYFIRTTEERHIKAAQALWNKMKERGFIYKGGYAGWYAVRDEAFYAETELVHGKAPTGADVEWVEEPSYFFKLSAFQEPLLAFYRANPDFIGPESRRNEVIRFVEGGLNDLSISRSSFKWGVPIPDDPEHVMYVWVDALTNYITALGYPDEDAPDFKKFWPEILHIIGKDILRFHAIYWPAFLMAAGLTPPKRLYAHGWWTNEGQKISKSLGNTIDPVELVETYGVDQVRYFLMREVPFGQDGDFSRAALEQRINSDLANDFGNLAQRVLSFVYKNAEAKVPTPSAFEAQDEALLTMAQELLPRLGENFEKQALHRMVEAIWELVGAANRYVDAEQPWSLRKTNPERMATVLYVLLETLRYLAFYIAPIMPQASVKLLHLLGISEPKLHFKELQEKKLQSGVLLPQPEGLFPRIEKERKE
ncbi:MAG: methionine--tRNA ligase [Candidatus Paracaedimonas acanthamoebae]|uniref:Methionine--tRNA ligase n=1 Tax=Candidatus Paracaedimonas acanthamoebae TaxID=244581 RepID=A0A8J7PIC2_9PROT|nr:methionine--tRNA ligase [Candidatus Paracaedimonas acanthamoebae]